MMRSSPFRSPLLRTVVAFTVLSAGHLWPSAPVLGPAPVTAQDAVVSGRLSLIWEEPIPGRGEPRLRHFVSTDDGRLVPLRLTSAELGWMGEPRTANGRFVEVSGRWTGPRSTPGATAARELQVTEIRSAAPPVGASIAASAAGSPILGSHPWVTVLCRFADAPTTEPHPLGWYSDLMSGTEPGMDHYWREVSFDQANVAGSQAVGWYDLPEDRSAYVDGDNADLTKLKSDCAAAADADVYFPDYEGINFQFNLSLGSYSWGGGASLNIDGVSRFYSMTWLADWAEQATYAHEMGHGFGLPHSSGPYGAVYDSNWDVMSGPWTFYDPTWGWLAPHTISYHKDMLGWIPADRIYDATLGSTGTFTLHRLADLGAGGDYLMARVPRLDGTYYTVEARRHVGYDTYVPAEAVILHHVRDRAYVVDPDNDGDPDDSGARWLPGETFRDSANGITVRVKSETPEGYTVTILVAEPGLIDLSPSLTTFSAAQGVDPDDQILTLGNTGTGNLAWSASDDATWLSLADTAGTLAAGGSQDIALHVTTAGLAPGDYAAAVTVAGNAGNSPQSVDVLLSVTTAPVINVVTGRVLVVTPVGTDPPAQELVIRNDGEAALEWTAAVDQGWMSLTGGSGTLAPGESATDTIVLSVAGLDVGIYSGVITVSGNAPNSPQDVDVTLRVTPLPSIALTALSDFAVWEGVDPDPHEFAVTNDGGGTLHWTAAADSAWLTLSSSSGSLAADSSASISVGVVASGLQPGTHTGSITVSGDADDAPQSLDVTVVVRARPTLAEEDVVDHLLGVRSALTAEELQYLDEIGNGSGEFDVGDFRAWLQVEGLMSLRVPSDGQEVGS